MKFEDALKRIKGAESVGGQLIVNREGPQAIENLDPNRLMRPAAVAEAYWQLYQQPRDAWTFEHEIRPFGEKW